jgi:NIPSNAP
MTPVIIEIRTYRLRPGTRDDFVRIMATESLPLLRKHGITVVDSGASLVDEDGHEEAYLIRAFASLDAHRAQEEAFYSSDDWLHGPREAIVSRIESYHTIVIEGTEALTRSLSQLRQAGL